MIADVKPNRDSLFWFDLVKTARKVVFYNLSQNFLEHSVRLSSRHCYLVRIISSNKCSVDQKVY